jgi:hypothetical protein
MTYCVAGVTVELTVTSSVDVAAAVVAVYLIY